MSAEIWRVSQDIIGWLNIGCDLDLCIVSGEYTDYQHVPDVPIHRRANNDQMAVR